MEKNKKHLPAIGVGPVIVAPQIVLSVAGIFAGTKECLSFARISALRIPFTVLGVLLIILGMYLWVYANFKTKIESHIKENTLATDGVYSIVRNPIYSAFFLICTGVLLFPANLILLILPVLFYFYMTVMIKSTEEKWLKALYGNEYTEYCKNVNRCIPSFPKKKK
ncbi:isoprenylcysteine carboxylmethyltransferase family protein [uncultured Treponema sp.]|uniref:methyltransferase family protein n=1 Tax=uncultured Treponema sp. TaxID=162155 RepID=UPI000E9B4587|nr:isoprenylcysteine carboxylmethyltransferase family protein [uncultured Treponema sp.]HAZ96984.1 protein-S-isoprenylcysteine methyltransferase [Treponema sp.]